MIDDRDDLADTGEGRIEAFQVRTRYSVASVRSVGSVISGTDKTDSTELTFQH